MITIELPSLSISHGENYFKSYGKKAGRNVHFPNGDIGTIISCAPTSTEDVDTAWKIRQSLEVLFPGKLL